VALLVVPPQDAKPWPTLGPQICDFIEERAIFGPGSLKGKPAEIDPEFRGWLYRTYEIYPRGHKWAGRRRFKRAGLSVRKGLGKTEKLSWIAFCELHPESPVRCDGFDSYGNPVGRPVTNPYIPLLSYNKEQVEELAYGALYVVVTEGPDADLFDASLERILRLDERGRADGGAYPLAGSPNARDGARTTFQGFDEPHRLYLPRLLEAHNTMDANLPKRPLEDPWSAYVGTAGQPGQGSVAENVHVEAQNIAEGKVKEPRLFYFHREASDHHDMTTMEGRVAAIEEATGPIGEFGPGQFEDIAERWDREGADLQYLERVWTNRWTRSAAQAFDSTRVQATGDRSLFVDRRIKPGSLVVAGFDGARFRDSTAIVLTEVATGLQQLWGLWERVEFNIDPVTGELEPWEIDEQQVTTSVAQLMRTFQVWRFNGDPPHWTETMGTWAGRWPCVEEWWTNRHKITAQAVRAYREAMSTGAVSYALDDRPISTTPKRDETYADAFARHLAAAGKVDVNFLDDDGTPLHILGKLQKGRVFDAGMAAVLSWDAYLAALRANAKPKRRHKRVVKRIR